MNIIELHEKSHQPTKKDKATDASWEGKAEIETIIQQKANNLAARR